MLQPAEICLACSKVVQRIKVQDMRNHIATCTAAIEKDSAVLLLCKSAVPKQPSAANVAKQTQKQKGTPAASKASEGKDSQKRRNSADSAPAEFVDPFVLRRTAPATRQELNKKQTRAFVSAGISFNAADNPEVLQWLEALQPSMLTQVSNKTGIWGLR